MKKKIIVFVLLIVGLIIYFCNNKDTLTSNLFGLSNSYEIIKLDENINYSGIGQEKINNVDGYFTTFTTINEYKKTYKEYKQNGNASWSDNHYWGGTMAKNGCGIAALATILSGYNQDYTPEDLRQKYFPVLNYDLLSEELSHTFHIKNTDFYYDGIHLSKDKLQEHLRTNRPILICVWNSPHNNRWTTTSHYLVLLATDDKDMVYVSNPNRW